MPKKKKNEAVGEPSLKLKEKKSEKKFSYQETVGEASLRLQKKEQDAPDSIELQREIHKGSNSKKSYEEEVWTTVDRGCKAAEIKGSFFVVVLFKKERHLKNVLRQLFFYRQSCPTPEYDQTVYHYIRKCDELEFLWTVPNNSACQFLPKMTNLPEDQTLLVSMVKAFNNGDLDKICEKHNCS